MKLYADLKSVPLRIVERHTEDLKELDKVGVCRQGVWMCGECAVRCTWVVAVDVAENTTASVSSTREASRTGQHRS